MQRRQSLKHIALGASGILMLPTWAQAWTREALPDPGTLFSATTTQTLQQFIDALLPASDTKGAVELGVPAFVQLMLKDCHDQSVQQKVQTGLVNLETFAQSQTQQAFSALSLNQKQALLLQIEKGQADSQLREVYLLLKNLSIQGYTTSEYALTNFLHYQMVPGHYHGCVPVK